MGLFRSKSDKKILSFGMGGYKFTSDENFISYQSAYGKSFRVVKSDIEAVSLDKGGMGKNKIKINGRGALLAEVELPKNWAEKAQEFILTEMSVNNRLVDESNFKSIEKLAELKEKGILTKEEFNQKKKQLLGF